MYAVKTYGPVIQILLVTELTVLESVIAPLDAAVVPPLQRVSPLGFRINDLLVDPTIGSVVGPEGSAHLEPRVLAVLQALAFQPGTLVSRRDLLSGGVELFEMKPWAGVLQTTSQLDKDAQVSLHAKSLVVDRRLVFIGSMNMDHRSKLLNTEMFAYL